MDQDYFDLDKKNTRNLRPKITKQIVNSTFSCLLNLLQWCEFYGLMKKTGESFPKAAAFLV